MRISAAMAAGPAGLPVDEGAARAFLEDHLGRQVEHLEFVGEGAWSRCFGFLDRGRDLVVRFGGFLADFEKDRRASYFGSPQLPVPEVLEVGRACDGYFAISSRGRGQPLEDLSTPEAWQGTLPSLFAALDSMRIVDLPGTRGYGVWDCHGDAPCASWREFLLSVGEDSPSRRTYGWRRKLIEAPGGDALFRAGHARLADLAEPTAGPRHLVHSDLINRNVLVEDGTLTAVFDWGCSLYGDFLYDVAWLEFWSPWYPALQAIGFSDRFREHCATGGFEIADFETRIQTCLIHIGLDHLAYNAHTGSWEHLRAVSARLEPMLA